ncbi:MAG: hypothetical protein HY290_19915 [Planctomycetia bacterium]|nr:hypothetical protein [Planctomycetia bacterium]
MRRLLFAVAAFGWVIGSAHAADVAPARPQGVGQLLVADPQSGALVRLNLARYHVNVVLHPPVALVQIDQSFYNPFFRQQEGTFVFNLPDGASVSRFAMYTTHEQLIEGELIDRGRAANIYQSIVDRQRDPAILEQIGGNLFRIRVFPIPPRDTKRILLDYTVPMADHDGGRCAFELPLMSDLEPIGDFAITGTIRGPTIAGTAKCESHPDVKFTAGDNGVVRFELRKAAFRPDGPLSVEFQQRPAAEATMRSYVPAKNAAPPGQPAEKGETPDPQCEFLVTISHETLGKVAARDAEPAPVDVLILADTSACAHPQAVRKTVRAIADSLRKHDRFRLGCVDVSFRPVSNEWIAPQSPEAEKTFSSFDREFFLGAVDFGSSIRGACESLPAAEPGRRRIVIYVGDGAFSPGGTTTPADVHKNLAPVVKSSAVAFGAVLLTNDPAGRSLMERLAAGTGGRVFRVGGSGSLAEATAWTGAACVDAARIVSIKADGVADGDLFAPPTWAAGSALHVFGRRKTAGEFKLQLTFEQNGHSESREWTLEARNDPDDVFVGRLWAQRKLDQVRALETTTQKPAALREQAIALSQEWTLLCPHTAFLVLEHESDYPKYGIRRSLRHLYWNPEEATASKPLSPEAIDALKLPRKSDRVLKPETLEQTLAAARRALNELAPDRALALLNGVAGTPRAKDSAEFATLRDAARQIVARADLLEKLGPQRGWFDRSHPIGFPTPTHDLVWQFVYGFGPTPAQSGLLAPLYKRVRPPEGEITLEKFIDWVRSESGLNVLMDKVRLTENGVAVDQPVTPVLSGIKVMTLHGMLRCVLDPVQLTYEVDGDIVTVTTAAHAADRLELRVYPVGDLILSTHAVPYSLLGNPELDRVLLADHRIEQKLDRKISVDFRDLPLDDVFSFLGDQLDDNLVIDRARLIEDGVALDQPITLQLRDVSVRQILKAILEPVQLSSVVENESIIVTTAASCADKLRTQIHSARDIVYELSPEMQKQLRPRKPFANRYPWQGGFGGMGSGGMGMGMGMGFMGGGGMGAGMGGAGAGGIPDSAIGLSETSETEGPSTAVNPDAPSRPGDASGGVAPIADAAAVNAGASASRVEPDRTNAAEVIDVIQDVIQPDSWEYLSGPGSIVYHPGALGFVVRQTSYVHAELDEFLDRLRALPPAFGAYDGLVPASVPLGGANDMMRSDFEQLASLLKGTVQPDSWDELSGPGSASTYLPKLTLLIRQTQSVHAEVRDLLTSLRRARYLARRGRIWKPFDITTGPWFPVALGVTDLPLAPERTSDPAPDRAEIQALEALAEPIAGEQVWRSTRGEGRLTTTTVVRISAARQEFELDGRVTRVEGEEAAVAYPRLTLVERGPWGAALRRIVDGRLPWLPHRSRRELAQLFAVSVAAQDRQTAQLKLALAEGKPGDEIAVTVDRKTGLPSLWEMRLAGKVELRLRFADLRQAQGKPIWSKVTAEDAQGRVIERWDLVSHAGLKSTIAELDRGWGNSVVLDLRAQDGKDVPPVLKALQAVRSVEGAAVDRELTAALALQPKQPLFSFLNAWNLSQSEHHETEIVALLTDVARSGASDLIRNIADGAFLHLGSREMYAVLREVPENLRTPSDWDRLARVAARSAMPAEAVRHLEKAIAAAGPAGDSPARARMHVQLLVEAGQLPAAVERARSRLTRDDVAAEDFPALADLLAGAGAQKEARGLITAALAHKGAVGLVRQRLLTRRADFETGLARWRTLVEAASLLPAGSELRPAAITQIVRELAQADEAHLAGNLAEQAKDPQTAVILWLAQAEGEVEHANRAAAADIGWKLYEANQLPVDRYGWFIGLLQAARQHERLIWFVEDRLRAGDAVEADVLHTILPQAYEALGRKDAAIRARTHPIPPAQPDRNNQRMPGMGGGFF